jgi:hypothetical protein
MTHPILSPDPSYLELNKPGSFQRFFLGLIEHLPAEWNGLVQRATEKSLKKALDFAIQTINDRKGPASSDKTHKILVFATGAGGGYFGLPALTIELPVTTTIMLRSIADIARSEGEQIRL